MKSPAFSRWTLYAFAAVLLLCAGCSPLGPQSEGAGGASSSSSSAMVPWKTTTSSVGWSVVKIIMIKDGAFIPASMSVKQGTVILWRNQDTVEHGIVGDTLTELRSSPLKPGDGFTYLFDRSGVFPYHCSVHPTEVGTVEVTP